MLLDDESLKRSGRLPDAATNSSAVPGDSTSEPCTVESLLPRLATRILVAWLILVPLSCILLAIISLTAISFPSSPPITLAVLPILYYILLFAFLIRCQNSNRLPDFFSSIPHISLTLFLSITWAAGGCIAVSQIQYAVRTIAAVLAVIAVLAILGATLTSAFLFLLLRDRRVKNALGKDYFPKKTLPRFPAVVVYLMLLSPSTLISLACAVFAQFKIILIIFPILTLLHHCTLTVIHVRHYLRHSNTPSLQFSAGNTFPPSFSTVPQLFLLQFLATIWIIDALTMLFMINKETFDRVQMILLSVACGLAVMEALLITGLLALLVRVRQCVKSSGSCSSTGMELGPLSSRTNNRIPDVIPKLGDARASTSSLSAPPPAYTSAARVSISHSES